MLKIKKIKEQRESTLATLLQGMKELDPSYDIRNGYLNYEIMAMKKESEYLSTVNCDILNECMFLSEGRTMKDRAELFKLYVKSASFVVSDKMDDKLNKSIPFIEKYKQLGETKKVKRALFSLYQSYRTDTSLVNRERDKLLKYIVKEIKEIKKIEPDFDFEAEFKKSSFCY